MKRSVELINIRSISVLRKLWRFLTATRHRWIIAIGTLVALVAAGSVIMFSNRSQEGHYSIRKAGLFSPYAYAGKAHDVTVSFGEKNNSESVSVTLSDKKYSITFAPQNINDNQSATRNPQLTGRNSQLVFSDVYPNTNLVYSLIRNGVKEDIVVKTPEAVQPAYAFSFELGGLKPLETDSGQLLPYFIPVNSDDNLPYSGSFRILPLYMTDAAGAVSYDIDLVITPPDPSGQPTTNDQQPTTYLVHLYPSQDWLFSEERVYPVAIDPTVVKGDPPLAHWGINEGYGTTLNDSTGNGKSLTISGPSWQVDNATSGNMVGHVSLFFDGTNDFASRAYDSGFDFGTGSFSISGWFKHTSTISGTDVLLARYSGAGFKVYMKSTGVLCFGIDDDATWTPDDEVCSTQSLDDSKWHHISAVKSTTSSITLYIDGVQVAQDASLAAIGSLSGSSPVFYLGIDSDGTSNPWHGFIDQLTIYDYALDAAQVKADAMATPQTTASFGGPVKNTLTDGLIGYWKMNDAVERLTNEISPGSGVNNTDYGSLAWSNPGNITASNNSRATVTLSGTTNTNYLHAGSFGFSIPTDATILGIQAHIERRRAGGATGEARDNVVRLVKGGVVIGDNRARTTSNWGTTDGRVPYGNSTELWGTTWTAADINASNFGLVLAATGSTTGTDRSAQVDNITITIYYTENNDASDSSGNILTLTNNGSVEYTTGKFGNAPDFVAASSQHFSTATTINGVRSVSFWTYPDANTNYYISLSSSIHITSTTGTLSATGFTDPKIFVNGVETTSISASSWQLVTVTTETPIDANQFYIGRQGGNYMDGKIDEVRVYNRALSPAEILSLYNWEPGPILYFPFDEGVGTASVFDRSGNNLSASMSGSMDQDNWVPGKFGKALSFDGSNDYLTIADNPLLNFGRYNEFSVSSWIKLNSTSGQTIIHKGQEEGGTEYDGSWYMIYSGTSNRLEMALTRDTWNFYCIIAGSTDIADGEWHHISAVVKRNASCSASDILIYVNGVQDSMSVPLSGMNIDQNVTNSDPLTIGGYYEYGSASPSFNGSLDEFKIYNYVRTPAQIVEDMNAGHPAPGSPVGSALAHYKFDEGYGGTAHNSGSGGSAYDGSLGGAISCPGNTVCPTWTNDGKFGKALEFNVNDRTYVQTNGLMGSPANVTLSAWVNTAGVDIASGAIISIGDYVALGIDGWGTGDLNGFYYDGSNWNTTRGGPSLIGTGWHHTVYVFDNINKTQSIYLNGVLVNKTSFSSPIQYTGLGSNTFIGRHGNGSTSHDFGGLIDEVKIYTMAMTADQVRTEYNQGAATVFGAGTDADGNVSWSAASEYCVPGDASYCAAPVGEWKFDEKTGGYAYDTSGNNNTGSLTNGPIWKSAADCKQGACLEFDGTDDYVSATTTNIYASTHSASFWFKTTSTPNIQFIDVEESGNRAPLHVHINSTVEGRIQAAIRDSSSVTLGVDTGTTTFNDGKWHFVTVVRNGADNGTVTLELFVNGVSYGTDSNTLGATSTNGNLNIGRRSIGGTGSRYFNGLIDDVKVYDYARTPAQIAWDYNRGGPVGWWRFDECTGETANDASGNGNNGTITPGASGQTSVGNCSTNANTMWYNGRNGKFNASLNFDGTDDYVNVGDMQTVGPFALSFWFKPAATIDTGSSSSQVPLAKFADANNNIKVYFSSTERNSSNPGTLTFGLERNGTSSRYEVYTSQNTWLADTWYHVIWVHGNSLANTKIYVNAVDAGTNTLSTSGSHPVGLDYSANLQIGGGNAEFKTGYFNGQIDDVRIYNYALTPLQIKTLYTGGAVRFGE